jgi:hypothetical protein
VSLIIRELKPAEVRELYDKAALLSEACQRKRRSRYAIFDRQIQVIDNPKIIQRHGDIKTVYSASLDRTWSQRTYLKKDLAILAGVTPTTITNWTTRDHILPPPMFLGKHPYTYPAPHYRWTDCYLYQEVVVILKHLKQVYSSSLKFKKCGSEWMNMNIELESTRNEIKEQVRKLYRAKELQKLA